LQKDKESSVKLFHHSDWEGYSIQIDKVPSFFWKYVFTDEIREAIRLYFDSKKAALSQVEVIYAPKDCSMQNPHRDHDQGPLVSLWIAIASSAAKKMKTKFCLGSHITTERQSSISQSRLIQFGDGGVHAVIFDPYIIHAGGSSGKVNADPRIFFTIEPRIDEEIKNLTAQLSSAKINQLPQKGNARKKAFLKYDNDMKLLQYKEVAVNEIHSSYLVGNLPAAKVHSIDELIKMETKKS
jgi:hypothetical protein